MDRYAFLSDLVTAAANCVPNAPGCEYDVFVGLGIPPADCSHIAAYFVGTAMLPQSSNCHMMMRERYELMLNRCCLRNIGDEFDAGLEDDDALCFLRDFGALMECIACELPTIIQPYVRTAQNVSFKAARADTQSEGGCYSGIIAIEFDRRQPCPAC